MEQTSGRYLYNADDVIDVYYKDNKMFFNWRGGVVEPVVLDDNVIFLSELYTKLHFVQHPETKEQYLSIISKEDESRVTYDYLKVDDNYKTPSTHFKNKDYKKAAEALLAIKAQDSMSSVLDERRFNSMGYRLLRREEYDNAIEVFKMNVALFPESDNVYDSLGEAYLESGDSIQAYNNYKIALEMNPHNMRAQKILEAIDKGND